ncbi:hypothetical protein F7725_014539, partial [Dissostichus mawsoni]
MVLAAMCYGWRPITNSDPKVYSSGCPERIRADRGTENVSVEEMQMFLRRNHPDSFAGERSFLYGRSTANQRIEGWWGILRKQSAQFWMNLFQTLQEDGHFTGDFLDELDEVVNTWNSHKIRPRSTDDTASGRPVIMYSFPELHSAEDRLKPMPWRRSICVWKSVLPKASFHAIKLFLNCVVYSWRKTDGMIQQIHLLQLIYTSCYEMKYDD